MSSRVCDGPSKITVNFNFKNLKIFIKNRISVNVSDVSLNFYSIHGCTARLQVGGYSLIHGPVAQVNELNAILGFDSDGSVECAKTSSMSSLSFFIKKLIMVMVKYNFIFGENFYFSSRGNF